MAKGYMNQRERTHFIWISALVAKANEILEEMSKGSIDKSVLKSLRTGVTWIRKGLSEWSESVDAKTNEQLNTESLRYIPALELSKNAESHMRKIMQQETEMRKKIAAEDPDVIYNLAECVLAAACRTCDGKPRDRCYAYHTMVKLEVPAWDESQYCRYSGSGEVADNA